MIILIIVSIIRIISVIDSIRPTVDDLRYRNELLRL